LRLQKRRERDFLSYQIEIKCRELMMMDIFLGSLVAKAKNSKRRVIPSQASQSKRKKCSTLIKSSTRESDS
jgi:hypothetical protein